MSTRFDMPLVDYWFFYSEVFRVVRSTFPTTTFKISTPACCELTIYSFNFISSFSAMWVPTIYFLFILHPLWANTHTHKSRSNNWNNKKSRNRTRSHLRDTESDTYYLPRAPGHDVAFNHSYSPSFEDVVLQLKKTGILDLPNVR